MVSFLSFFIVTVRLTVTFYFSFSALLTRVFRFPHSGAVYYSGSLAYFCVKWYHKDTVSP
ncbi:hypothetical protein HMPREF1548_06314 [Clostridium sp. KLE 1755]|nr:hypothetical protein HMPREF1548_06314 [Clostridium sp. KLE 1755]